VTSKLQRLKLDNEMLRFELLDINNKESASLHLMATGFFRFVLNNNM